MRPKGTSKDDWMTPELVRKALAHDIHKDNAPPGWNPTSDIAQALAIAQKILDEYLLDCRMAWFREFGFWHVTFHWMNNGLSPRADPDEDDDEDDAEPEVNETAATMEWYEAAAQALPLAVCRAAVKVFRRREDRSEAHDEDTSWLDVP